ncbi:glutathione S-transferase Mu 5 [Aplysia californica]|uniref:glutathione transferase n=1 Tax=Aplysia californica TaxID=6500 RepID=A0ABM0JHF5_APLCA|nr:glutathione S-transferase Mu 5 [Aplysia californica]
MAQKLKIGYWKIRGLGQPIRLLLTYAGAEFDEDQYEQGEGPEFSRDEWLNVKPKLGLDFPNLPYLFDGDVKITQSNAILRYLGAKFSLLGEDPKVQAYSEMMLENAMDMRNALVRLVYSPGYDENVDKYFTQVDEKFKQFEAFLGKKDWFAGGKNPTICDFHIYELLDQHRLMRPESLKGYSNLLAFLDRFEALPQIKAFLQSDKCIKRPVNNKCANWK